MGEGLLLFDPLPIKYLLTLWRCGEAYQLSGKLGIIIRVKGWHSNKGRGQRDEWRCDDD